MNQPDRTSLHALLNLIPAHTWYANSSGTLTFVNDRCADWLGLPKEHALRLGVETGAAWDSHMALVHPSDGALARGVWSNCIASGMAGDITFRVRGANGLYRWFLSRAEPLMTDDGARRGWIGINIDIELQKQTEFYLGEGQRLGRSGSWAFGPKGFQYWSSGVYQIHGLEPSSPIPSPEEYLDLIHPDDRPYVTEVIESINSAPTEFDFTKRIIRPDRQIRYVRCVGVPATGGTVIGYLGTCIDVTEQELSTAALRKSEKEFRQIVDLAPQLVAVLGPRFERLYANRPALDYIGCDLAAWQQEPTSAPVHTGDRERLDAFHERLPVDAGSEFEMRILKSDGTHRWFLARYNPVCDDHGQLNRWYVGLTDIDERKKAEDRLRHENIALREEIEEASMFEEIIGQSAPLKRVLSRVAKVATSDLTVLITGETGTGKELVARAIHRRSSRGSRAFVAVNCAAIPRELIASELFGHEKGSFTGATQRRLGRFELADGGTLFLDEVSELQPDTQAALLRLLQEQEIDRVGGQHPVRVDVRVIAATNSDLNAAVAEGAFRQDLFYRLHVFPVQMPPLRERSDDIPLLVQYFVDRFARKMGKLFRRVNSRTLAKLQTYPWPGNVRELQNVIQRSVIVCDSEEFVIDDSWLSANPATESASSISITLTTHEKALIEDALRVCRGRVFGPTGAAKRLGIPRSTLESKIRTLRIDKLRFRRSTPD